MIRHYLNLTKKSARWVPKLLLGDMKKERVRTSENFFGNGSPPLHGNTGQNFTMDESAV
jgi:hypothetical protein